MFKDPTIEFTLEQFFSPCLNDEALHFWLKAFCGLDIPRVAVCPHHSPPFDYIRQAYFEPAGDVVVWAPRGGGKTRLAAAATLLDLVHKPGCAVRILGGSLDQSNNVWKHLADDIDRFGRHLLRRNRARVMIAHNEATAEILAQSGTSVRGQRVQKMRCDEVEMFDSKIWEAAMLTTRSLPANDERGPVAATVEALSTMHRPFGLMNRVVENARKQGTKVIHWCILDVLERCPPERDCATCELKEECNGIAKTKCSGHFTIEDAIRLKRRVSIETWQAEMLCRRPSTHLCVFPNFQSVEHVKEDVNLDGDIWLGIDFGFNAPFVCLWICSSDDGTVYVFDEYVQRFTQMNEHIKELESRSWPKALRIGCDPAGAAPNEQTAMSNIALLRKSGYIVKTRSSKIQEGLEMIRAGLKPAAGAPRLFIHPRCKHLIRALMSYHFADDGLRETPVKDGEHDHLIDALRYFYVNRPIQTDPPRRY